MTRAVNDATLQKAGDIYQYLIALRDCFELNDGDSPAVEVVVKKEKKNPKRVQRDVKKQLQDTGIGTKSQQALKLQQEQKQSVCLN
ncbi:MAG: DUF2992 family protein [Oliverpabstia intestinalis]|nr:DUF2992 family protein [Oliverpabstia intestinalis]MDD6411148.1 DUF2992 family protein [Oliverpabstia intestinalis]